VAGSPSPRAAAARAVHDVSAQGRNLDRALEEAAGGFEGRDRAFTRALAYETVRGYPRYAALTRRLLTRPLKRRDRVLADLVAVGLCQLEAMRVPAHAAVKETVAAVRNLGRPAASGLVNAVLRRYQRERSALVETLSSDPEFRWAHPGWLIDRITADWPADREAVLDANNRQAPMWVRVNRRRSSPAAWAASFAAGGGETEPGPAPESLRLARPVDVGELPGFGDGEVSVQDAAAQLAAGLLDPRPGERILDACAAPGGKTGHLLELAPDARVTALDADEGRTARVIDNLARLGVHARVAVADAGRPEDWHDGSAFDAILLDAPCSGTGVIRRHPDIKLLRRPDDVPALAAAQDRLLDALWPLLRPGGRLLYCTCSILREENAVRIEGFLSRHQDACAVSLSGPWGRADGPGRQILPGEAGMDGFYYACLNKSKNGPSV
jgi:16S rRNA (cytosine967-C5)-methyltransferase